MMNVCSVVAVDVALGPPTQPGTVGQPVHLGVSDAIKDRFTANAPVASKVPTA